MKPFLKRFFFLCLLMSFTNMMLVPQSLPDTNVDTSPLFMEKEEDFTIQFENLTNEVSDSSRKSPVLIKGFKKNSRTEYVRLKSKSGVFSVFNEIIYYWFHQL
jgi:hypothetical protein